MKYFRTLLAASLLLTLILFGSGFKNDVQINENKETHGGEYDVKKDICVTDEQRTEIWKHLKENIAMLKQQGKLSENNSSETVQYQWPLAPDSTLNDDYSYYGISNFVDHDASYPNHVLDYNCGSRTYDTQAGYNHQGTDIYLWPFSWYKMDNRQVKIVAAAPGTIIYKSDGNFDRNCAFNNGNWNAVYIQHADGSVAWYGHMKMNSLTPKSAGQTVALGEYLGSVGSSGSSTGPHLHFEVYNASNQLQDPWQGTCNNFNSGSLWASQKPYWDPQVNKLMTHSAPPVFPACPTEETLNQKNNFQPGEQFIIASYYHDQQAGQQSQYSIIKPDNSVFDSWTHSSPQTYSSSYWYWTETLPGNAQNGVWKFREVFNSQTYEHNFTVGPIGIQPVSNEVPEKFFLYQNYPNPFNPSTKISFDIAQRSFVILIVYDIQGREISKLVGEELNAGKYSFDWNAGNLSSGVYFISLKTKDFISQSKIVLLK